MLKYKTRFLMILAMITLLSGVSGVWAETWHLEDGQDWEAVSAQSQDKYLMAVAKIKKSVNMGKARAVREAMDKLKKDYPEIAGAELDDFIEAEILFCEGKFVKAVRGYDKFLAAYPQSKLYEAVLDREFAIATAFLAGHKKPVLKIFKMKGYAEGVKIMESISDRAGDAPIAIEAVVAVARHYEKRTKFDDAYNEWSQISSQWPTGQIGKDALLGMGRCKHAAYKGPHYEISDLISAKSYYENFKLRYPEDAEKFELSTKIEQINEQIALKNFSIGKYYQKTGNMQAANFYYEMVQGNWPESIAAEKVKRIENCELLKKEIKK